MLSITAFYLGVGALAGILSGLLGLGGGLVIVPVMVYTLPRLGVSHELIMHLALGTALASIIFTSLSSTIFHNRKKTVAWQLVFRMSPGIILGTFSASFIAAMLSTSFLKLLFAGFIMTIAWRMTRQRPPKPERTLPSAAGVVGVGGIIGFISGLVGIAGGSLSVPFMIRCNIEARKAIATSAAIALPIAVAGTLGYGINGWGQPLLPPWSLGYIYLPALIGIVSASMLTAPAGVALAHHLPVDKLKKAFAAILVLVALQMIIANI